MTLADAAVQVLRGSGSSDATIEIGRAAARTGTVVRLHGRVTSGTVRLVLELAFDRAGGLRDGLVGDPGFWAGVIAWAAHEVGVTCSVPRPDASARSARHAVVIVEAQRMLALAPEWPLVRLAPTMPWLDLRGETALARGPSDAELARYAESVAVTIDVATLHRMFEQGVLEWGGLPSGMPGGRRRVRCAR